MSQKSGTGAAGTPSNLDILNSECASVRAYCLQVQKCYKRACGGDIARKRLLFIVLPSILACLSWGLMLLRVNSIQLPSEIILFRTIAPVLAPICAIVAAIGVLAKVDRPPMPFSNIPEAVAAISLQCDFLLELGRAGESDRLLPEVKDLQSRLLGMMRLFEPDLKSLPKMDKNKNG